MDEETVEAFRADPIKFGKTFWPHVSFFKAQRDIIYSVRDNDETFVTAGNMLGKDFVAGFICLWFFLTRNPVRIVTTSVKDDHLRVLWGEIGRFVDTCKCPLRKERGGPLLVYHREIRKLVGGQIDKISYVLGMVSEKGEAMAGHHAEHTLAIFDEASGIEDINYTQADTWAKRKLVIGNPNPCSNFFYKGVTEGDLKAVSHRHLH